MKGYLFLSKKVYKMVRVGPRGGASPQNFVEYKYHSSRDDPQWYFSICRCPLVAGFDSSKVVVVALDIYGR